MTNDKFFYENFEVKNIKEISGDQEAIAKRIEGEFTDLVAYLKSPKQIDNPSINKLMSLFESLVGNLVTPVALTNIQSLHFYCEQRKNKVVCLVMCPSNWHEMLIEEPFMQMGGLAFIASQAKDYWNHRFTSEFHSQKEQIMKRAQSTEAELLHYFSKNKSDKFVPNDYQKEIMLTYPEGIKSEPSHYEGREYDGKFPPFPFSG